MIRKHPGSVVLLLPLLFLLIAQNASGQERFWEVLTFFGGNDRLTDGLDFLYDAKRDRYILLGRTQERDLPVTPDAMKTRLTDQLDGFIAVFNGDCSELVYCSYIGGSKNDAAVNAILLDDDRLLLALSSYSHDLPTTGSAWYPNAPGSHNTWLVVLSLETFQIIHSGFFGGSSSDAIERLVLMRDKSIVATGHAASTDMPVTADAFQRIKAGRADDWDAFIAIFDSTFDLKYCSYHGGSGDTEDAWKGLAETENYIVFSGLVFGPGLPVTGDAHQKNFAGGYFDCYLTVVSKDGMERVYSSYLGGSGREGINAIVPVGGDRIVIVGSTDSRDFPVTANAWQVEFGDTTDFPEGDCFVAGFSIPDRRFERISFLGGNLYDFSKSATFDSLNRQVLIALTTYSNDFPFIEIDRCDCSGRGAVVRVDPETVLPIGASVVVDIGDNVLNHILVDGMGRIAFSGANDLAQEFPSLPVRPGGFRTVRAGKEDLFIGILRDTPVGVEAVVEVSPGSTELVIFPQPVHETLRFAVEGTGAGEAVLMDLLGRKLVSVQLQGNGKAIRGTLGLGGVAPGMYMLVVRTPDMVRTGKVIVAR